MFTARITITSRYLSEDGATREARTYWVQAGGGYVYDVTDRPGVLGQQVCARLSGSGHAITASPSTLARVVRRELARRRAAMRRDLGPLMGGYYAMS